MSVRQGHGWRGVPRGVWALGFVSLLMDVSSELIHALLPLLLVDSLGVGVAALGVIEGVSEATAAVTRCSQVLSLTASASASCWLASPHQGEHAKS